VQINISKWIKTRNFNSNKKKGKLAKTVGFSTKSIPLVFDLSLSSTRQYSLISLGAKIKKEAKNLLHNNICVRLQREGGLQCKHVTAWREGAFIEDGLLYNFFMLLNFIFVSRLISLEFCHGF